MLFQRGASGNFFAQQNTHKVLTGYAWAALDNTHRLYPNPLTQFLLCLLPQRFRPAVPFPCRTRSGRASSGRNGIAKKFCHAVAIRFDTEAFRLLVEARQK